MSSSAGLTVLRWLLRLLLTASISVFIIFAARKPNWLESRNVTQPSMLLLGGMRKDMVWYAATAACALAAVALFNVPSSKHDGPSCSRTPRPYIWWHKVSTYQLPPRCLWSSWCGGLDVRDAAVMLAIVAACYAWIYRDVVKDFAILEEFADWNPLPHPMIEGKLDIVAKAIASGAKVGMLLVLLPVPRSSFLQQLLGAEFGALLKYHRWIGHLTFAMFAVHGAAFCSLWIYQGTLWKEATQFNHMGVNRLCGVGAAAVMLVMWGAAAEWVRRRWYALFFRVHVAGFCLFTLLALAHNSKLLYVMLPGLALYCLDVLYSRIRAATATVPHRVLVSDDGLVASLELLVDKDVAFAPGASITLNVPSVDPLAWHSFSVASPPVQSLPGHGSSGQLAALTLHVKHRGRWTGRLLQQLQRRLDGGSGLELYLQGPHSSMARAWQRYRVVVLVAGGIGITPLISILRELQAQHGASQQQQEQQRCPCHVYLVWAVRHRSELGLLDQDLIVTASQPGSWLTVSLHCTGANGEGKATTNAAPEGKASTNAAPVAHIHAASAASDRSSSRGLSSADDEGDEGDLEMQVLLAQPSTHKKLGAVASIAPADSSSTTRARLPTALQPCPDRRLQWLLDHLLCLAGAYGACMLAWLATTDPSSPSAWKAYWLRGVLSAIALPLGAMLLPALVLLPRMWIRHRHGAAKQQCMSRSHSGSSADAVACIDSSSDASGGSSSSGRDLPGAYADRGAECVAAHMVGSAEGSEQVPVHDCRPNIPAVLSGIEARHAHEAAVGVFCSGPPPLVQATRESCSSSHWTGRPYLAFHQMSAEL